VGLGGPGYGDVEAEGLDLPDVVTELAVGIGAGLVVAVAEVGEPGSGVGQQVPGEMMTRMERMERATATWALALPRRQAIRV
jgi:hypothetical protein